MTDLVEIDVGVRQLQSRYINAVWRRDYAEFAACFTDDAEWHIAGRVLRGPDECVAFLKEFMPLFHRVRMTMQSPILNIRNGEVLGRTDVLEHNILADRSRNITIGIYYDRFVQEESGWRFAMHFYQLYYLGPPDMSGDFYDVEDYGPPCAMPGAGESTVRL